MEDLYRKETIEKLSAPDKLDEYIRVIHPGVWMTLIGIIALLVGVCVWGFVGNLETTVRTACVVRDGKVTCYVPESSMTGIKKGSPISVEGETLKVESVSGEPVEVTGEFGRYVMHLGGLNAGDWVYEVSAKAPEDLANGSYTAVISVRSEKPVSFLLEMDS